MGGRSATGFSRPPEARDKAGEGDGKTPGQGFSDWDIAEHAEAVGNHLSLKLVSWLPVAARAASSVEAQHGVFGDTVQGREIYPRRLPGLPRLLHVRGSGRRRGRWVCRSGCIGGLVGRAAG